MKNLFILIVLVLTLDASAQDATKTLICETQVWSGFDRIDGAVQHTGSRLERIMFFYNRNEKQFVQQHVDTGVRCIETVEKAAYRVSSAKTEYWTVETESGIYEVCRNMTGCEVVYIPYIGQTDRMVFSSHLSE